MTHAIGPLLDLFEEIREGSLSPVLVKANTCKGRGVSFMENDPDWHGRIMTRAEYERAMDELKEWDA